jgi:LuxR family maltose regulon positive regulatory protein
MPRAPSPLAKLSRPRLHGAIPRERLFERLDALQHQAVTLVAAPPGAGRTTLVAGYLDSRKIGGIWFQLDEGDRDPATFFYCLGSAASMLPARSKARSGLPLLTPEYSGDLPGFARRYFRDLFSRTSSPCAVVFDNLQEIGDDGPLRTIFSVALEDIPAGARVLLISRDPPPDQNVRLAANRTLGMIGFHEPVTNIGRISPTPLLMILASDDVITPTADARAAFDQAGQPKKLVVLPGWHLDGYNGPKHEQFVGSAVDWFREWLKP